jgi:hypothetical protein
VTYFVKWLKKSNKKKSVTIYYQKESIFFRLSIVLLLEPR